MDRTEKTTCGCVAFSLLIGLVWWGAIAFVAYHFISKYW